MPLVDILEENYQMLKEKAKASRYTLKEYVNYMVYLCIQKDDMLQQIAPNLSLDSVEDDKLIIIDRKENKLAIVYVKDNLLYCEFDNKTDCIHTRYAWAIPEVAKLKKKMIDKRNHNNNNNKEKLSTTAAASATTMTAVGLAALPLALNIFT